MTLALGSCLRSNDAWGAGGRGLMVVEGPLRQAQGERTREAPLRRGVGDALPGAPLWIPAFAGTTVGGCGVWGVAGAAGGGGVRVPLRRDGRFANRPYEVWGVGDATGVWMGCPARRPFLPSISLGTNRLALPLWVPAFAGVTRDGGGTPGDRDAPAPRPCPGFPLSREGRWGVCGPVGAAGGGGPFDRLRANGFGKRACGGEWGMRWGTETPRAAPLWIPAFAGMTRVGECGW